MIRMQVVEREGGRLFETLKHAMRSGELKTFRLEKGGRKVTHVRYPGRIKWENNRGVITCEFLSPRPGDEWQLLSAFVGRLAHRYGELAQNVSIQFESSEAGSRKKRGK